MGLPRRVVRRQRLSTGGFRLLILENHDFIEQPRFERRSNLGFLWSAHGRMYSAQALNWLRITASEVPFFE